MTWRLSSMFWLGQRSGHQRSPKVKFCRFQQFPTNQHITRKPEELQCPPPWKAHSIALLTFFHQHILILDLRLTVWAPKSKNSKHSLFCEKGFPAKTSDLGKTRHPCCRHYIPLFKFKTRRMKYNLTLKVNFENLISDQGHDLIGKGHVEHQSIHVVVLNTSMAFSLL